MAQLPKQIADDLETTLLAQPIDIIKDNLHQASHDEDLLALLKNNKDYLDTPYPGIGSTIVDFALARGKTTKSPEYLLAQNVNLEQHHPAFNPLQMAQNCFRDTNNSRPLEMLQAHLHKTQTLFFSFKRDNTDNTDNTDNKITLEDNKSEQNNNPNKHTRP